MEITPSFKEEKNEEVAHYMERFANPEKGQQYVARIEEVADIIEDDPKAVEFLESLLNDVGNYAKSVYKTETHSRLLRFKLEGKELHRAIENVDRTQRAAHDRLIDDIRVFNRYLFEHFPDAPAGGIAPIAPEALKNEDRDRIAAWAFSVMVGYLSRRV